MDQASCSAGSIVENPWLTRSLNEAPTTLDTVEAGVASLSKLAEGSIEQDDLKYSSEAQSTGELPESLLSGSLSKAYLSHSPCGSWSHAFKLSFDSIKMADSTVHDTGMSTDLPFCIVLGTGLQALVKDCGNVKLY